MATPHTFRMEHTETKTTSSQYGDFYEKRKMAHISLEPEVAELLKYVDASRKTYIEDLRQAVAIKSVSGVFKHRNDVTKMIDLVIHWFKKLKVKYECFDIGWQKFDGLCCKLPVVVLGSLGKGKKKMLCIYAHLDVTNPEGETWDSDPWELVEKDKALYGKGIAYGKGPLICWFHAIEAYQKHNLSLPVNLKFIIESMNIQSSEGLETLLKTVKPTFLHNVDCVVVCGSEWLGNKYPCLVYGTAGRCRFEVTIEQTGNADAKEDMDKIFSTIVDENNRIIIPHFHDHVEPVTPAEERVYDKIDFNFDEIKITLPKNKQHWDKGQMLMNFWRLPDIAIGNIEKCDCEKNDTTKIKRCFTIKIVPKQTPHDVAQMVMSHVYDVCKATKCSNKVTCEMVFSARPWLEDFRNPTYEAARRATVQIYKEEPNMIREDREIPELLLMLRAVERDTILFTLVNNSSNSQKGNENILLRNLIEGTKLMISFLKQLSYNTK